MNDQEFEIINRETKKQKIIDFVKKNKNIFIVLILSIIFCVISFFSYEMYLNNKRSNLANKFNNSVNAHKIGSNENIVNNMVEIINSNDKTYSPLALYYLIDNNLISSIDEINKYFVILPDNTQKTLRKFKNKFKKMKKVKSNFNYNSEKNDEFLSVSDLKNMIKKFTLI